MFTNNKLKGSCMLPKAIFQEKSQKDVNHTGIHTSKKHMRLLTKLEKRQKVAQDRKTALSCKDVRYSPRA